MSESRKKAEEIVYDFFWKSRSLVELTNNIVAALDEAEIKMDDEWGKAAEKLQNERDRAINAAETVPRGYGQRGNERSGGF
jgi:hypothetical protein